MNYFNYGFPFWFVVVALFCIIVKLLMFLMMFLRIWFYYLIWNESKTKFASHFQAFIGCFNWVNLILCSVTLFVYGFCTFNLCRSLDMVL